MTASPARARKCLRSIPYALRVSSRLACDQHGRLVAEGTCVELRGLRWLVLGDTVAAASSGLSVFFLAEQKRGRAATAREQAEAKKHAPYRAGWSRREREQAEPDDDEFDEQAALEAARLEQQRTPADLVNQAA